MNAYYVSKVLLLICIFTNSTAWATPKKLRIGVSLHAYYSWVANIVGNKADVISIIPAGSDPHSYQPRPEDLIKISNLDVLVSGGLGHDDFIDSMLQAASTENLTQINPNQNVPLIPDSSDSSQAAQPTSPSAWNSHSFLSIISAVQQIGNITEKLAQRDSDNRIFYKANAKGYIKKLRTLLANALSQLEQTNNKNIKLATVHDGYAYLFQDLGLTIDTVVQPRHGIDPSPKQLADTIKQLKKSHTDILFTEVDYGKSFSEVVAQEVGTKVYQLSHISSGVYSKKKFEQNINLNIQQLINAIKTYEH